MAEPVWGQLEKSQVDNETIEQAVDRLITAHLADAGAHALAAESLKVHKDQAVVDHPADSIVTDKIKDVNVTNPKLKERVRGFAAVVDAAGNYDYTDIQLAINYVNGLGGGRILILAGTYTPAATLTLYSNIELVGEDKDTTIIDFATKAFHGLTITGIVAADIINVRIREVTVKNVNTIIGKYGIFIEFAKNIIVDSCYFTNNRTVGVAAAKGDVAIADNVDDRNTEDIIVSNCVSINSGRFVLALGTKRIFVENNYVDNNAGETVELDNCTDGFISFNRLLNIGGDGIQINYQGAEADAGRIVVTGNILTDSGDEGIKINGAGGEIAERIVVIGNIIIDSFNIGIHLKDTNRCIVKGNIIEGTTNVDGIKLTDSDYNIIEGNVCTGADDFGINISGAGSDKNIVLGNHLLGNTGGALQDNGTATELGHNVVA